jgi:beta-aspartyl-peptidase (threonine type)
MESSGTFNAGVGSCLTSDGRIEADAGVMVAGDAGIGAVAAVPGLGNASALAEQVRLLSPHCLLVSDGALAFALRYSISIVQCEPSGSRLQQYQRKLASLRAGIPAKTEDLVNLGGTHDEGDTVGAIARDSSGELAVVVSTGGIWLKAPGRVGDSPLAGSGFWAESGVGAACATGIGEFIVRGLLSRAAIDHLRAGMTAQEAADRAIADLGEQFGPGKVGIIVTDAEGRTAFSFDTAGMGRIAITEGRAVPAVAVWPKDG